MAEGTMIRPLEPADAAGCDAVLATLPRFFGDPDGIRDCAEAVRTQRGFVAADADAVRGFLTLQKHIAGSEEITWMAVAQAHRRHGLGRLLVAAAARDAAARGEAMLFLLTLGPSGEGPEVADGYDGTRRFYQSMGFVPLREFDLASWNQAGALVLAKPIIAVPALD